MARKSRKGETYIFKNEKGVKFSMKKSELDRAIDYLKTAKKKVKDNAMYETCKSKRCGKQMESEISLHCRQLPSVAYALRDTILRQDWRGTVILTSLLCQPGTTLYAAVIIRACLILLFNHPNSNTDLLEKFIRSCTGYKLREELIKFIKILFSTREEPLPILGVGQYIRPTSLYRIVDDVAFKDL